MPDNPNLDRDEAMRRKLEDLEDAYGPAIRLARRTPGCTDIAVNADGRIWVTMGGETSWTGEWLTSHALRRIVNLVADIDDHPIEKAALSANLPTGERFAALLPPTVEAITISIRLPPDRIYTLDDYVAADMMRPVQQAILREAVSRRDNVLIVGGTGAGKTTLANALLAEDGFKDSRVCIAQDQRELQCSGSNVLSAVTGPMTTRDLVKEFLRHNPDRIVIGEIRDGHAAEEWIGASNTGHPGGLSTTHANSASKGLLRLASLIGKVTVNVDRDEIVDAIGLVVYIEKQKDGRRLVVEIVRPVAWRDGKFVTEAA